jgi:GMP synthase (glutamine-hydrolysing)
MGLQAAEIRHGRGVFWGVQYHPEYSYAEIAATAVRYGQTLVAEGLFADAADIDRWVAELRALDLSPDSPALNWKMGLGPAIQDRKQKLAEIDNWLHRGVLARRRAGTQQNQRIP